MNTKESEALAKVIASVTDLWDEPLDEVRDIPPIVNAILAAGWQPPGWTDPTPVGATS